MWSMWVSPFLSLSHLPFFYKSPTPFYNPLFSSTKSSKIINHEPIHSTENPGSGTIHTKIFSSLREEKGGGGEGNILVI